MQPREWGNTEGASNPAQGYFIVLILVDDSGVLVSRGFVSFSRLERLGWTEAQFQFHFFIVLHHLHHVTTDTLQYIRTIIIPNKRTLHNDKKRKMCAVTKVA